MRNTKYKVFSIISLVAVLVLQLFWIYNTYGMKVDELSKECDNVLNYSMSRDVERRLTMYKKGLQVEMEGYSDTKSLYEALGKATNKGFELDSMRKCASKILNEKGIYSDVLILRKDMKKDRILEESKFRNNNVISPIRSVKSNPVFIDRNDKEAIVLVLTNGYRFIIGSMWLLILTTILTCTAMVSGIIEQLKIIEQQKALANIRNDFSYAMVHDMKSPLSSIIMGCNFLKSGKLDDKPELKNQYFSIVENEANHLLSLVNKLLTISKLENKKMIISKSVTDIETIIKTIINNYETMKIKDVEFVTDFKTKTAFADENYITETINNLVDNAMKYSGDKVKIEISCIDKDNCTLIKVRDNGIGISKSDQKIIFDKFERSAVHERNRKNGVSGFGLGLNYVYQVMKAHGGKVTVNSELGRYSEFTLYLPKNKKA